MKTTIITILSICIVLVSACKNDEQSSTTMVKDVNTIAIDDITGIDLTLWAESKEEYECIVQDSLIKTGERWSFVKDLMGMEEFDWRSIKLHMNWMVTKGGLDLIKKEGGKFVVIGDYQQHPNGAKLYFTGDVYKY